MYSLTLFNLNCQFSTFATYLSAITNGKFFIPKFIVNELLPLCFYWIKLKKLLGWIEDQKMTINVFCIY